MMASRKIRPKKKRSPNLAPLTDKQNIFVEEYLADNEMNAARAAKRAGYADNGAGKLIKKPQVQQAIARRVHERLEDKKIEGGKLIEHMLTACYLDPALLFTRDPATQLYNIRDLDEVPVEIRQCITKLKCKRKHIPRKQGEPIIEDYFEVEFMSKDVMCGLLMRHFGLAEADNKGTALINQTVNFNMVLQAARERNNVVDGHSIIEAAK